MLKSSSDSWMHQAEGLNWKQLSHMEDLTLIPWQVTFRNAYVRKAKLSNIICHKPDCIAQISSFFLADPTLPLPLQSMASRTGNSPRSVLILELSSFFLPHSAKLRLHFKYSTSSEQVKVGCNIGGAKLTRMMKGLSRDLRAKHHCPASAVCNPHNTCQRALAYFPVQAFLSAL